MLLPTVSLFDFDRFCLHYAAADGDVEEIKRLMELEEPGCFLVGPAQVVDIQSTQDFRERGGRVLKYHPNIDASDSEGHTPLMLSAARGRDEVAEYLLRRGAAVDVMGPAGTALHVAVEHGAEACVELLLRFQADVNAERPDGLSALHIAADTAQPAMARILLREPDVDVDLREDNGFTPLMYAVCRGCEELVGMLIAAGCNVDEASGDDDPEYSRTAMDFAEQLGQVEIARMLVQGSLVNGALGPVARRASPAFLREVKAAARRREWRRQTLTGIVGAMGLPAVIGASVAQHLGEPEPVMRA